MRKVILLFVIGFTLLLTSCWDQNLLINKKFINGISFDLTEDDQFLGTVRALTIQNKGGGQFDVQDELVHAIRPGISGLALDINNKLPGQIDATKSHIILIGEKMAKKGIHSILELFYRNKNAYVSARIVIAKEKGSELLSLEPQTSPIAFVVLKGLQTAETTTKIPKETVFTTWSKIVDPGKDVVLPYVEKDETDKIRISGISLFNGDKYSGISLNSEQSSILLLLMDRLGKIGEMVTGFDKKHAVAYNTIKEKRELEIKTTKSSLKIIAKINLTLDIQLNTSTGAQGEINIEKLSKELSKKLTKQSQEVTKALLDANCDALGIGRKLSSSHPEIWKKLDWEKDYKNVQFETKVKVNIIKTGSVF